MQGLLLLMLCRSTQGIKLQQVNLGNVSRT
jgi:hypothetical protein